MLKACGQVGQHGARERTVLLLAYRHGLRVGELVVLRWDQVDLKAGLLHVARLKNGIASTHPSGPRGLIGVTALNSNGRIIAETEEDASVIDPNIATGASVLDGLQSGGAGRALRAPTPRGGESLEGAHSQAG